VIAPLADARILVTNDDGVDADGVGELASALHDAGLSPVVIAPASNQSGVSRTATYRRPVSIEPYGIHDGVRFYACPGTPVDCVRVAILGGITPNIELIVSGINHGPNLGDDSLNSGTVGAAVEGALLGQPALAISQQSHPGYFHILDSIDPTTPVYHRTAEIGAMIAGAMLASPQPARTVMNVNVPALVDRPRLRVTRLGRRFYDPGSLEPVEYLGLTGYLTYGLPDSEAPRHETESGTDFGAVAEGLVSMTPLIYSWHDETAVRDAAHRWAVGFCEEFNAGTPELSRLAREERAR
jgi:5'-nucleotidase